jgi:hypothetical protein
VKDQLQRRRNTIRFLLPRAGSTNAFLDRDLLILARAEMKAMEWSGQSIEYKKLHTEYQGALRDLLKKRFDRFAVLHRWSFADPGQCLFNVEALRKQGAQIPEGIEEAMVNDLFVPEDFEALVLEAAGERSSVGKLLRELQEPRAAGQDCIPWLGEPAMKERILRLCARGKIAINLRGLEHLQAQPGEDEDTAWKRLRPKLSFTGRQLDEVILLEPSAVPATGGTTSAPQPPVGGGAGGLFGEGPAPVSPPPPMPPSVGGNIFGDGTTGTGGKQRIPLNNPPTSPLNLIGKIEGWGIRPATRLAEVSLKVAVANGAQLKELLKKLPEGLTYELNLQKEDE